MARQSNEMPFASRVAAAMAVACAAVLAMLVGTAACAKDYGAYVTEVDAPDFGQFEGQNLSATQAGVSRVLEKRCGTLDCHGQIGRPLRIYGEFGLRFVDDAGNQPGVGATTQTEYEANYQSVIGLQPEIMTLVVEQQLPAESLMLLRKPLQLERHKGGAVFVEGDDAYNCFTTWLGGQADYTSCGNASQ
jgi:hypothetical protein